MAGEEVFLRGLYELVSGEDQFSIAENVFGRDQSIQSRSLSYFIRHIYSTFLDLLVDNLQWWYENGFVAESRRAITEKLRNLGLDFDEANPQNVGFFIDCNCLESCRVAGGPAEEGPNADRWADTYQRAFYNGWKSVHGLKHQTLDTAHGFTVHLYGPTSLRRNDLKLLGDSRLNQQLAAQGDIVAYGDSIYPHLSNITSSHRGGEITVRQRLENGTYKSVRISIEWNYGVTANIYGYLKNIDKLKVLNGNTVVRIYTVATLLRNCHIALYGGISSDYFGIPIPDDMLERYLQVN